VCAGDIVEEREILSKLLLAKADRELFSLILQLVRVPCFDLQSGKMIDDTDLGFFANFLGICIFVLVVAYHYVVADPKYEVH
jgi:hypothetical protein